MRASKTIPRLGPQDPCTNYHELLRQGLDHCQDLGGDLWTDFNQHDPGVTILQQLCYAITDLSYRTDFWIADIMAPPPPAGHPANNGSPQRPEQPLYTGDRILTTNPVTVKDYQKLLYDRIDGLKNSWLAPIQNHPQGVGGLYEVLVEMREDVDTEADRARVRKLVEQFMRATRNLGEDVDKVTILEIQPIRVDAVVEIRPQSNPVTVLAAILFEIQNSLIPFPSVQFVDELFQSVPPDQIWNGPPLQSGALNQRQLKPLKSSVDDQEIINIILGIKGVKQVKSLRASSLGSSSPFAIKPGYIPRLDPPILKPQEAYTISIELEGGVKSQADSKAVWARIRELEANAQKDFAYAALSTGASAYRRVPVGEYKGVEEYFSIQHQFPVVYGLSKYGVSGSLVEGLITRSRSERQTRVRQLKAYLLFFEQLLANYLSQLANIGGFFSLDDQLRQTYFYQPLAHYPPRASEPQKIDEILIQQTAGAVRNLAYYLVCIAHSSGRIVFVSNRVGNLSQAEELRTRMIESGQDRKNYRFRKTNGNEFQLTLHSATGAFLAMGQERFATADAARSAAETWARVMTGLVGIKPLLERLVKIYRREDLGLQIVDENSRILLTSTGIQSQEEVNSRVEEIVRFGADPRAYRFIAAPRGGVRLQLQNDRGQVITEGEERYATEFDAEEGVERLAKLMGRMAGDSGLREHHIRRLPEVEEIGKSPLRGYYDGLEALERQHDNRYLNRRNDVLNHLLARFGEQFDDDILEQLDVRPFGERDDFYHERIRWKIEFLRAYIDAYPPSTPGEAQAVNFGSALPAGDSRHGDELGLGSGRGQGFDYGASDGLNAVSGMERRLSLLLGLQGHMNGAQYDRMDKESPADPGFYYVEKQVSSVKTDTVKDDRGDQFTLPRHFVLGNWRAGEPDLYDLRANFVFSSEDSGLLRPLLSFGTNKENYAFESARDGCHVLFHSPSGQDAMEIHRAASRESAERAVEALIRYLEQLNQSTAKSYAGERIWIVEHVLLRPRSRQEHSPVRISHPKGPHLSSGPLHPEVKPEYLDLVLRQGQNSENYRIQQDKFGDYIAVLYHENQPIAYSSPTTSDRDAAAAITLLVNWITALCRDRDLKAKHVHLEAPEDFYSYRLSVLLPNWPLRFQSNEFKLYAEQMVQENCPSHLAADCFWLSAHDQTHFENLYAHWRSLSVAAFGTTPSATQDFTALDEASDELKVFIQRLKREQERWTTPAKGKA